MVLYGVKKQFAASVESGAKTHTIRDSRKNGHAKPGDKVHLYTGLRTKACRKLIDPDPTCWGSFDIDIEITGHTMTRRSGPMVFINGRSLDDAEVEALAIGDGFTSVEDFFAFFAASPPEGKTRVLICWEPKDWLKRFL
jgi:hypothetical protein